MCLCVCYACVCIHVCMLCMYSFRLCVVGDLIMFGGCLVCNI